jgi:hypothetical protein
MPMPFSRFAHRSVVCTLPTDHCVTFTLAPSQPPRQHTHSTRERRAWSEEKRRQLAQI